MSQSLVWSLLLLLSLSVGHSHCLSQCYGVGLFHCYGSNLNNFSFFHGFEYFLFFIFFVFFILIILIISIVVVIVIYTGLLFGLLWFVLFLLYPLLFSFYNLYVKGEFLSQSLTQEMTSGEMKFHLECEALLTSVALPDYRFTH